MLAVTSMALLLNEALLGALLVKLGYVTPEQFDEWVRPEDMVGKI